MNFSFLKTSVKFNMEVAPNRNALFQTHLFSMTVMVLCEAFQQNFNKRWLCSRPKRTLNGHLKKASNDCVER